MNKVAILCALLVAVAAALDWVPSDSSDFNRHRYRRNDIEGCQHPRPFEKLCCAAKVVKKMQAGGGTVMQKCLKEIVGRLDLFSCEGIICMAQCVGKKMNVLDSDGNPNVEELRASANESFSSESWLGPLQDQIISTCLDEASNAMANRNDFGSSSCNPASAIFGYCVYREIQLNCPDEEIKDKKSCARLQERIRGSDFFQSTPQMPPGATGKSYS